MVDICNAELGKPYQKCKKSFEDAYDDCARRLGIFKFLCKIVSACKPLCNIVRIGQLLCAIVGAIKDLVVGTIVKGTLNTVS